MLEIKNSDDFDAMVIELFEDVVNTNSDEDYKNKSISFSDRAKELIHTTAEYARTSDFYNELMSNNVHRAERDEYAELAKTKSASLLWIDMCNKILCAPTSLYMGCVPILLIPILDDKLRSESNDTDAGRV